MTTSNFTEALLRIKIKKLKGSPYEWESWWETWEAYVHEDESISDRRKYTLLRQSLDGQALAAIAYLPKTEDYYETAINDGE